MRGRDGCRSGWVVLALMLVLAVPVHARCAVRAPAAGPPDPSTANPFPDLTPAPDGRRQTVVEVEVELEAAAGGVSECMVGLGLGSTGEPAPDSATVDEAVLIRQIPGRRGKSIVLPWIAQSRGVLLVEGEDQLFAGSRWSGFTGTIDPASVPALRDGEVFTAAFAVSVDPADVAKLEGLPVQFAAGGTLSDGLPNLDPRSEDRIVYFGGGVLPDCVPTDVAFCLNGGRFRVTADWTTAAAAGPARIVSLPAEESGNFYFFAESNWELTVKVLNACTYNERYWVFLSGLTDVGVEVKVVDTRTTQGPKVYVNPQGRTFAAILDTDAFATCP